MKVTKARSAAIYTVMILLLCMSGIALYRMDYNNWRTKELALARMNLDSVADTLEFIQIMRDTSDDSYEAHMQARVRFMASALSDCVEGEAYSGPRLFDDGAVVEIRGGRILWPEGVGEGFADLGAEDVRQETTIETSAAGGSGERMLFSSAHIGADYYYVDWVREDALLEYENNCPSAEDFLKTAAESFDGTLLLVSTADETLPLLHHPAADPEAANAAQMGLTLQMIEQRVEDVQIAGTPCMCVYSDIQNSDSVLVCGIPLRSLRSRCLLHVLLAEVSALIILVTLTHYMLSIFEYTQNRRLPRSQALRYHPKALRRTLITGALSGTLILFISVSTYQTLGALHDESIIGARSISYLFEQTQKTYTDWMSFQEQQETEWVVSCGERIASLIEQDPRFGSSEKLKDYSDRLGIDTMMLFDSDGRQMACSTDYYGFTLDNGLGAQSRDFRRLLLGVPSIVHEVSTDSITGLTRRYIGVRVPFASGSSDAPYGALVMAILPVQEAMNESTIAQSFLRIDSEDLLLCYVDPQTGSILYATDDSLPGMTVMECGLPERSLAGDYTDFVDVRNTPSYVTVVKQQDVIFFYIIRNSFLFSTTLPAAVFAAVTCLLMALILILLCTAKYDENVFNERVDDSQGMPDSTQLRAAQAFTVEHMSGEMHGLSEGLVRKNRSNIRWGEMTPEKQTRAILKLNLILLVLLPILCGMISGSGGLTDGTLLSFLLHGNWSRGFNMFAFCSIMVVLIVCLLLLVVCNAVLSLIAGFTGKSGETVCRLLYSLASYIAVFVFMYYTFEFVGLPMSTYIASLSVVSLALSLGAKDMISDILAGLLIVFEGQFQVGDSVEIDGACGTVLEIGVRSTRLLSDTNDDILYITNSNIRSILNKSKRNSVTTMELTIVTEASLEQVEDMFKRALDEIGKGYSQIISGPILKDVIIVSSDGQRSPSKVMTLRIATECRQEDYGPVKKYVRRQVFLFCEREGLEI